MAGTYLISLILPIYDRLLCMKIQLQGRLGTCHLGEPATTAHCAVAGKQPHHLQRCRTTIPKLAALLIRSGVCS